VVGPLFQTPNALSSPARAGAEPALTYTRPVPGMPEGDLRPIPRSPLYEQVIERLRAFIDATDLQPGDRLMSERELAERLGVSRTSVRQALTALRARGTVEIRHGDGVYLLRSPGDLVPSLAAEIAESEVDHGTIWEVREGLEVEAARLAATRREEDDLLAMRAALEAMAASVREGGDGIAGDRAFHAAVATASHNPLLRELVAQLAEAIDRTSAASLTVAGRPPISLEAHRRILDAVEAGDGEEAAERMRDHIRTSAVLASVPSPSHASS
jgi:GntR family transcriptional regulator, transcriptional repressor for pyruvate dehydrogenase complex